MSNCKTCKWWTLVINGKKNEYIVDDGQIKYCMVPHDPPIDYSKECGVLTTANSGSGCFYYAQNS